MPKDETRIRHTEVAIVGAGPVGILLAILLARAGRKTMLIERWPDIYDRPRAVTMDAEVARILAMLGIDVDTDPSFENHKELYYWRNAELKNLQIVDWESLAPSGWHVTYWFNQPELEARLLGIARGLANVEVRRGWTADTLRQSEANAELELHQTGNPQVRETVQAAFVVGADGANSFVRDALGIGEVDRGYFFDWLILDMVPEPGHTTTPAQWQLCDPKRPTTIVPGGPGRRRWEFMVLPSEDAAEIAKPESAWRLMEPWGLTPQNATLERSAVYRFQAKWAKQWVDQRCIIAGDAAHLMPPFAGEGMCAGLRDAVALSWRLAGILDGTFGHDILRSYETERMEHAKHYIQFSQDLGEIICITDPEEAAARDARMMAELAARGHAPITGDLVKLGKGLWCEDTASAGELSPQGIVRFDGIEDRFDQAVGQGWFVIAIGRPATNVLSDAQARLFARLSGRVLSIGAAGSGCDVIALDPTYDTWATQTGIAYAILRPDFYVAATAKTVVELRQCFDLLTARMGQENEANPTIFDQ